MSGPLISLLVFVAILSVLGWVAYKRPVGFVERLTPALIWLLLAVLMGGLLWNAAVSVTTASLLDSLRAKDWKQITAITDTLYVPYSWLVVGCGGGAAYLLFINWLLRRYAVEVDLPLTVDGPRELLAPTASDDRLPGEPTYTYTNKDGTHGA